jgi:HK97 gp10 family phage protein
MPGWAVEIVEDTSTSKLAGASSRLLEIAFNVLDQGGADIEAMAKELVHVRTGYLRSTIYHKTEGLSLECGATADYAVYQEFGTRRMAAHPYLRPALDAYQDAIYNALLHGCIEAITKF